MRVSVGCGVIIAMLLVAMDVADVQSRLLSLAEPMRDDRIGLWLAGMTMFLEHPFTGTGAGTFGFSYPDVVSLLQLPDGYQAASGFVPVVHNVYLELLAEYGLPGFLAYAIVTSWLVGQLTSLAIFGSDAQSTDDSDDARRWAVALLISWSSMLVARAAGRRRSRRPWPWPKQFTLQRFGPRSSSPVRSEGRLPPPTLRSKPPE